MKSKTVKLSENYNIDYIRSDFPIFKRKINDNSIVYLDSGASAQKPQIVIDSITNCYENYYSNVHRGIHSLSQEATDEFEESRRIIQQHVNAPKEQEIIFTAGTTESINLLARSLEQVFIQPDDEILVSEMAHHANIVPWQLLCERSGAKLRVIPINDEGEILIDEFSNLLSEKTKLVSVAHVSNVLGTVNPVKDIITMAHQVGSFVHLDGAQAVPHMQIDVQDLDVDFYSFSGHKVYGPTGTGVLYGKEDLLEQLPPYQGGGDMIDVVTFEKTTYNDLPHKFEAGTPNIAGFIGLGTALQYIQNIGLPAIEDYEHRLGNYASEKLNEIDGLRMLGTAKNKAAVFSFVIDGCHPLDVGTLLNEYGIAVRTGHHCCQPLMRRMGVTASIRASLAMYNTKTEIDYLVEKLNKVKEMLL